MQTCKPFRCLLFQAEGFAIGALIHSGVGFMAAHGDAVQTAVVFGAAMMRAVRNMAFDALVGMVVHLLYLLYLVCLFAKRKGQNYFALLLQKYEWSPSAGIDIACRFRGSWLWKVRSSLPAFCPGLFSSKAKSSPAARPSDIRLHIHSPGG